MDIEQHSHMIKVFFSLMLSLEENINCTHMRIIPNSYNSFPFKIYNLLHLLICFVFPPKFSNASEANTVPLKTDQISPK